MNTLTKENIILQIIKYAPSVLMITLVVIATVYITIRHNNDLEKQKIKIHSEYLDSNKERIQINMNVVNRYIEDKMKNSEQLLKQELHEKINLIHNIASNIYKKNKNKLSKKQIISQIKYAVETIRFDEGRGYFSIHTMKGINVLNPVFKKLEGTSVLNRKDSAGRYPVQIAIDIAKTKGEGFFYWDYFKPDDRTKEFKKFGIVKKFEPYNLIFTTAIFEDDFRNTMKNEILHHLSNLEYVDKEYVFIFDTNKMNLLLTKAKFPQKEHKTSIFFQKINTFMKKQLTSEYIEYPYTIDNNEYLKISYLMKMEGINWIIGTGFNFDKLNARIKKQENELIQSYYSKLYNILLYAILVTFALLIVSLIISKLLQKMFYRYNQQVKEKEIEKANNYFQTIISLVDLIEKRDFYTAGHSRRVAQYSVAIAKAMKFNEEEIHLLEQIGLLHDIGKIAIPDSILLKPGRLTDQEFDIIKSHASIGYDVIAKIPMFKEFSKIILSHHERYDGSGYPNQLKGDEIPLLASVLAIADSFDAMTSTRIYNKTRTVENALQELQKDAGTMFEPSVVKIAIKVLKDIDIEAPTQAKQLPRTPIEKERFSYFFRDALTNFSNENYLNLLLKQDLHQYKCLNLILIHCFSIFNEKNGWQAGNELLVEIAKLINQNYEAEDIFRFHGPNFILLNSKHIGLDLEILNKKLHTSGLRCELHHFDKDTFTNLDIVEEYLNK